MENYLASRERKLRLSDAMFQALEETADGQFRVLIGIDDSSEEDSIQKNEIAYLRAQLRQGDALLSGVDDLAFKAVTSSAWRSGAGRVPRYPSSISAVLRTGLPAPMTTSLWRPSWQSTSTFST